MENQLEDLKAQVDSLNERVADLIEQLRIAKLERDECAEAADAANRELRELKGAVNQG